MFPLHVLFYIIDSLKGWAFFAVTTPVVNFDNLIYFKTKTSLIVAGEVNFSFWVPKVSYMKCMIVKYSYSVKNEYTGPYDSDCGTLYISCCNIKCEFVFFLMSSLDPLHRGQNVIRYKVYTSCKMLIDPVRKFPSRYYIFQILACR